MYYLKLIISYLQDFWNLLSLSLVTYDIYNLYLLISYQDL